MHTIKTVKMLFDIWINMEENITMNRESKQVWKCHANNFKEEKKEVIVNKNKKKKQLSNF